MQRQPLKKAEKQHRYPVLLHSVVMNNNKSFRQIPLDSSTACPIHSNQQALPRKRQSADRRLRLSPKGGGRFTLMGSEASDLVPAHHQARSLP